MPSGHLSKDLLTRIASGLALGAVMIFLFQNCGKAGFQRADTDGAMRGALGGGTTDPKVAAAPFPYKANLNQVSYMSCPMSSLVSAGSIDPFAAPFYNVRAGAYDNARLATVFGLGGVSDSEKANRLTAGLGLTQEFLNYVDTAYRSPKGEDRELAINTMLTASPYKEYQLGMGLLNENNHRSTQEGDFGFSAELVSGLLSGLGSGVMPTYLSKQQLVSGSGTKSQSFYGSNDRGSQSLIGSFSRSFNEADISALSGQLRGSLILHLGYTIQGENSEITQFLSPLGYDEKSIGKTLYGRGYKMQFRYEWPGSGGVVMPTTMMTDVTELDMTVTDSSKMDISFIEGQKWDCFALRIVRHQDRIDPTTKRPYVTPGVHHLTTANNQAIQGVRVACPVQDVAEVEYQTSGGGTIMRGINNQLNNVRLQMARRFLPAELWEINTDPDFLCAVPNELALSRGKCYASGDKDQTKYIQYDHDMGGTKPCGNGANECPAYVSICYRTK